MWPGGTLTQLRTARSDRVASRPSNCLAAATVAGEDGRGCSNGCYRNGSDGWTTNMMDGTTHKRVTKPPYCDRPRPHCSRPYPCQGHPQKGVPIPVAAVPVLVASVPGKAVPGPVVPIYIQAVPVAAVPVPVAAFPAAATVTAATSTALKAAAAGQPT